MKNILSLALIALAIAAPRLGGADELMMTIQSISERENVEITEITRERSYVLGLDEKDFDGVLSAAVASGICDNGGTSCIIVSDSPRRSREIYAMMWKNYEFPACDDDDKIIFIRSGAIVAYFKGKAGEIEAHTRSFGNAFDVESMKIIKNKAKR